jgi:pimeloyl-ACP methyl ester carboxylesterase
MTTATTGRFHHRWVRRLLIGLLTVIVALPVIGAVYQGVATSVDRRSYPAPGRLVDIGGYRLHVYCTGSGAPTVILDALFPGTVSNWVWVQTELAKTTRVCAYDRAGLGWSDRGPQPRDAQQHAAELDALLAAAAIPGPYVLVGHSWGGLVVRAFADRHPNKVAGMVLVEASNPDAWRRLGKPEGVGVDHRMLVVAPYLGRVGAFRSGLIPSYTADPDLPSPQREQLQAFFDTVKSLQTIRDVDSAFPATLEQVRHTGGIGTKPLAVVLGSKGDGSIDQLRDLFAAQARLSSNSVTRVVEGATHAGLVDNQRYAPQTTAAILEVVHAVRTSTLVA